MLESLEGWESMCSEDAGEWVLWVREGGREVVFVMRERCFGVV